MTVRQLYTQTGVPGDFVARDDRLLVSALVGGGTGPLNRGGSGVWGPRDFELTWTSNSEGRIAEGIGAVAWAGGHYLVANDSALALSFNAPHASLHRIDSVIAQVYDAEVTGSSRPPEIRVLAGVPASSPVAPGLPAGAMRLYNVRFNAGVPAGVVTDVRSIEAHSREGDPHGIVAWFSGLNGQITIPGTISNLLTWNVPNLTIGRHYEVVATFQIFMDQVTSELTELDIECAQQTGDSVTTLLSDLRRRSAANESYVASGRHHFQSTATTATIHLRGYCTPANSMRVWQGAQYSRMWLKDSGIRPATIRPTSEVSP